MVALQLLDPGGAANVVYRVQRQQQQQQAAAREGAKLAPAAPAQATAALGRLEIKWRGTLGDTGRLQTQQIQAEELSISASVRLPHSHPPSRPRQASQRPLVRLLLAPRALARLA